MNHHKQEINPEENKFNIPIQDQANILIISFKQYVNGISLQITNHFEEHIQRLSGNYLKQIRNSEHQNSKLKEQNKKLMQENQQQTKTIRQLQELEKKSKQKVLQSFDGIQSKSNISSVKSSKKNEISFEHQHQEIKSKSSQISNKVFLSQITKDQFQNIKTFIQNADTIPTNIPAILANQTIDSFQQQTKKVSFIKHKKHSFEVSKTKKGITFTKIASDTQWSVFSLFALSQEYQESMFTFKRHRLKKGNLIVGVGIYEELLDHKSLKRQNIFAFAPYNGGFRGNNTQKVNLKQLQSSNEYSKIKINKAQVAWTKGDGYILHRQKLTQKMNKQNLLVFIALCNTKDCVQLMIKQ